jgi:hypothetical protein
MNNPGEQTREFIGYSRAIRRALPNFWFLQLMVALGSLPAMAAIVVPTVQGVSRMLADPRWSGVLWQMIVPHAIAMVAVALAGVLFLSFCWAQVVRYLCRRGFEQAARTYAVAVLSGLISSSLPLCYFVYLVDRDKWNVVFLAGAILWAAQFGLTARLAVRKPQT